MTKPYQVLGVLLSALQFLAPCQSRRAAEEFVRAKTALLEVSMKADSAGMVRTRQRFEHLLQDKHVAHDDSLAAWAHYFIAFANWQLAFATFNNQEGAKKVIADALAHLTRATEKKADLIEAYAVERRCLYWRYVLDPSTGKTVWSESKAALEKARSLAPKHPLVVLEEAVDWFKLDLSSLPNPNAFGINLVVDTDLNQQTGAHWWGSNRAFTYDKLVTVWVIKDGGEAYRGTAGIADVRGVQLGRYSNLFRNNLAFRVDAESKTMLLGLKHKDLDEDDEMNLVAAAGAHVGWNDDIPDTGSVRIRLHRP